MGLEIDEEYVLPLDLVVGLKHCRAFEEACEKSPTTLQQQSRFNGVYDILQEYNKLLSQLASYGFDFKRLDDPSSAYNDIVIYFALPLPLHRHLLGESNFAERLGFITREEVLAKRDRYLGQQIPIVSITYQFARKMGLKFRKMGLNFARRLGLLTREEAHKKCLNPNIPILRITYQLAIEMGLVKSCEAILTSVNSIKTHPNLGSQFSLTLLYSQSLHFWQLEMLLLGAIIDIPDPNDPNHLFQFQIDKMISPPPSPPPPDIVTFV